MRKICANNRDRVKYINSDNLISLPSLFLSRSRLLFSSFLSLSPSRSLSLSLVLSLSLPLSLSLSLILYIYIHNVSQSATFFDDIFHFFSLSHAIIIFSILLYLANPSSFSLCQETKVCCFRIFCDMSAYVSQFICERIIFYLSIFLFSPFPSYFGESSKTQPSMVLAIFLRVMHSFLLIYLFCLFHFILFYFLFHLFIFLQEGILRDNALQTSTYNSSILVIRGAML